MHTLEIICAEAEADLLASVYVDTQNAGGRNANLALGRHLAQLAHRPPVLTHDGRDARLPRQSAGSRACCTGKQAPLDAYRDPAHCSLTLFPPVKYLHSSRWRGLQITGIPRLETLKGVGVSSGPRRLALAFRGGGPSPRRLPLQFPVKPGNGLVLCPIVRQQLRYEQCMQQITGVCRQHEQIPHTTSPPPLACVTASTAACVLPNSLIVMPEPNPIM